MRRHCLLGLIAGVVLMPLIASAKDPKTPPAKSKKLDRAALEKQFHETLSGSTLVGTFTVAGQDTSKLQTERYTISKVTKLRGDTWLFTARIQYGKHDLTVPMPLEVQWAGDTPMITLTDLSIPGLGTFTSRVLIYGDRYAGTWQHGNVGGHLFGKIEKTK